MRRTMLALGVAVGLAVACATTQAATAVAGELPVGRCLNMGNHLEAPNEGDWGRPLVAADFANVRRAGFTTVRIPVRWSAHAALDAPYAIDAAFLARVRQVVGEARAAGLNVIVNDHNFDALHADPQAHAPRLAGIWRQVALALRAEPDSSVWFEIANEPHKALDNANLLRTLGPALAAIRESNPHRPVVIGGEFWSGIDSLATLELPDDPQVYPTFHYYEPFDFTHQGAEWVDPSPPLGRRYGTPEDAARLVRDLEKVRAYVRRSGKTPFVGEFGAHTTVPDAERVRYQRTVREAFDTLGLGACAWAYTNTFPLYDSQSGAWVPGMRAAMGLPE